MGVVTIILIGIILICLYKLVKSLSYWRDLGVPQYHPLAEIYWSRFGLFRKGTAGDFFDCYYNAFPNSRYIGIYQFSKRVLFLKDLELIKKITVKDSEHFVDRRTFIPEDADPLWGKNLFALTGKRWRDMRTTLSPSFTSTKVKDMFLLMRECAEKFADHFSEMTVDNIIEMEIKHNFMRYCNDVIASVAFGVEVDSLKNPNNEFFLRGQEATDIRSFWKSFKFMGYMVSPALYRLFGLKLFSDQVSEFFKAVITESVKAREENGIVRYDLINLLLDARKGLDANKDESAVVDTGFATVSETKTGDENNRVSRNISNDDITAQAMAFFFAGFESVSSAMGFMAYELAVNSDIQQRLREEILETFENCHGKLKYEALVGMKYMDMVLSETLRKWPPQVGFDRVCTKAYTIEPCNPKEKPLHLEEGIICLVPSYSIHRDPNIFPEPEVFDPERFNDVNRRNINAYAYTPFGSGPRNCIGSRFALLETKVLFFYLLLKFEIVPVSKTTIPLKMSNSKMLFSPEGGFWLGLKNLQKQL